jgi:antitoxin HicB
MQEGFFEEVEAAALKRAVALKLADLTQKESVKKTMMAKRIHTSRAALDRLFDSSNTSVTLATLNRTARALGRKLKIELVAA